MKPFLLKILESPNDKKDSNSNELERATTNEHGTNETIKFEDTFVAKDLEKDEERLSILRDIEAIIGSMEEKQSKQTETILHTIEHLVGNMHTSHSSRPISSASSFSVTSLDRIDVKSPIIVPSKSTEISSDVENEVKHFVSKHIQEIVPDVAAKIHKELNESQQIEIQRKHEMNQRTEELLSQNKAPVNEMNTATMQDSVESVLPKQNIPIESNNEFESQAQPQRFSEMNSNSLGNGYQMETLSNDAMNQKFNRQNKPKLIVHKSLARASQKQNDKKRIRELERQLRRQQRNQKSFAENSRSTEYLSDSTVIPDEKGSKLKFDADRNAVSNEKTFSLSIVEHALLDNNKEFNQSSSRLHSPKSYETIESDSNLHGLNQSDRNIDSNESNDEAYVTVFDDSIKDVRKQNLSELVQDTKNLIKQMKNEIDEDIAMSVSEFDDDDDDLNSSMEDDNEIENSDSWEDIDDDDIDSVSYYTDEEELIVVNRFDADEHYQRSSQSIESEYFVEAQEEFNQEYDSFSNDEMDFMQQKEMIHDNVDIGNSHEEIIAVVAQEIPESIEIANELTSNDVTSEEKVLEISDLNGVENTMETLATIDTEDSNLSIDGMMEHFLEIQNSLQSSASVSLNIREAPIREKSSSLEPSSHIESNTAKPEIENESVLEENAEAEQSKENVEAQQTMEMTNVSEHVIRNETSEIEENDDESKQRNYLTDEVNDLIEISGINIELRSDNVQQSSDHNENNSSHDISEILSSQSLDTESEIEELSVDSSNTSNSEALSMKDDISQESINVVSTASTASTTSNEKLVASYKYTKVSVSSESNNMNVMQLKKIDTSKSTSTKNKIPVRRLSFSEPSATIKNIQNELFNKQQSKIIPKIISKKPSKIVPPKLFFRDGFAAQSSENTQKITNKMEQMEMNKPSTSKEMAYSTPKKKYYETCFSDDYQTSDDENPITSKKVIPNLVKIVELNTEDSFDAEVRFKMKIIIA